MALDPVDWALNVARCPGLYDSTEVVRAAAVLADEVTRRRRREDAVTMSGAVAWLCVLVALGVGILVGLVVCGELLC